MTKQLGKITQIVGVVVDAEFQENIPAINDALTVSHDGATITLEVAQHLDEHTVRAIALSSTDGPEAWPRSHRNRCPYLSTGWRRHGRSYV